VEFLVDKLAIAQIAPCASDSFNTMLQHSVASRLLENVTGSAALRATRISIKLFKSRSF
jgi:hypothetical protein